MVSARCMQAAVAAAVWLRVASFSSSHRPLTYSWTRASTVDSSAAANLTSAAMMDGQPQVWMRLAYQSRIRQASRTRGG